jgi:hypothetical protein
MAAAAQRFSPTPRSRGTVQKILQETTRGARTKEVRKALGSTSKRSSGRATTSRRSGRR